MASLFRLWRLQPGACEGERTRIEDGHHQVVNIEGMERAGDVASCTRYQSVECCSAATVDIEHVVHQTDGIRPGVKLNDGRTAVGQAEVER